jgi:hypothetical protein
MGLIRLDNQYEKLYVVGCSFTTGFLEKNEGSWGTHLAEKLNCKCQIAAGQSSSNYSIITQVVNVCEGNDMSNSCVGVQFSERSRREMWSSDFNHYETFNISTLQVNNEKNLSDNLKFVKKNINFFDDIWFNDNENVLRTTTAILLIKGYLESKNIDFIMFEGISTINDEIKNINIDYNRYAKLLDLNFRRDLLNEKTFFKKYGPMQPFNRTHPLFDETKNGGHPNSEFVKWWANEMYEHIKDNQ